MEYYHFTPSPVLNGWVTGVHRADKIFAGIPLTITEGDEWTSFLYRANKIIPTVKTERTMSNTLESWFFDDVLNYAHSQIKLDTKYHSQLCSMHKQQGLDYAAFWLGNWATSLVQTIAESHKDTTLRKKEKQEVHSAISDQCWGNFNIPALLLNLTRDI